MFAPALLPGEACQVLRTEGLAYGSMRGFGAALWQGVSASQALAAMAEALGSGDPQDMSSAILGLLGLGPGATPAGDDVLLGIGAVEPCVAELAAQLAPGRTADLSAGLLRAAADGQLPLPLRAVAGARGTNELADAARRLCAVGGSSGTDALVGLYLGLGGR